MTALDKKREKNPTLQEKAIVGRGRDLSFSQVRQNLGTIESGSGKILKNTTGAITREVKITPAWTKPSWMNVGCHAG